MEMNTIVEQQINTTLLNWEGIRTLPKGDKQMLLVSEAHIFDNPASHSQTQKDTTHEININRTTKDLWNGPWMNVGLPLDV